MFDVLIIGGGVSGISCALVLGSAQKNPFVKDKKIAIITHQKASSLQDAIFYNAYGIPAGKLGADILVESTKQLQDTYPHIQQIAGEKVLSVLPIAEGYEIKTTKQVYTSRIIVVAVGSSNLFAIDGLTQYVEPHQKSLAEKQRIQLKNVDHKVAEGIYVAGTLAGHRSQLAIASGSGASVATDILVLWNNGVETHSHDSVRE
ncbi:FAD-dependent oxidoreductase [Flavobacterium luminosum]|uniref:NAD(P)/FAD-dependent oxidoreductase n=1 Tax=Flavobacterium luminosum TaxID=2949086 RepID=A0ABT0TLF1_9FLAO|nr:FAD-dependent oxidoreductase [Flavobacterium sp. HXWNR70]MCL9808141.1 NAD(P)/FAD-dependent oxidoreductase [Flavobacterium sp. HXWNR70]